MVTERDLRDAYTSPAALGAADIGRAEPQLIEPSDLPVEKVMFERLITLGPEGTMEEAARIMRRERIGALPILEYGRLVGILTRSDVLDVFLSLTKPNASSTNGGELER